MEPMNPRGPQQAPQQPQQGNDLFRALAILNQNNAMREQAAAMQAQQAAAQAAGKTANQRYRNPGQTGMQSLLKPTGAQSRALIESGRTMLNRQPGQSPAGAFANGAANGLDLLTRLRQEKLDRTAQGEKMKAEAHVGNRDFFGNMMGRNSLLGRGQAPINRPASLQEWDAYQNMTPEQRLQYDHMKRGTAAKDMGGGLYGAPGPGGMRPLPGQGQTTEETREDFATAEGQLKRWTARQTELGKQSGSMDAAFESAANNEVPALQGALADTRKLLEDVQAGRYQKTGPVEGMFFRYSDAETAQLQAKQIAQVLKNLQIVNLAPVTEKEIALLESLYASIYRDPQANIGALQEAVSMLEGKLKVLTEKAQYYQQNGGTMQGYGIGKLLGSDPNDPNAINY